MPSFYIQANNWITHKSHRVVGSTEKEVMPCINRAKSLNEQDSCHTYDVVKKVKGRMPVVVWTPH